MESAGDIAPANSTSPDQSGTADLCARIRAGDEVAFTILYAAWFDRLMAFARAATRRDEAFAADVVQETFLRVIRSLPLLTSDPALESWLFTTARRVAIDTLRSELARQGRERTLPELTPSNTGPEQELVAALAQAIEALEAHEREALVMRVTSGLTLVQAAASMGITADAAHGRVRRSLTKLRTALARLIP